MINVNDRFLTVFDEIEQEYDEFSELVMSVEVMSDYKLYNFYLSKLKSIEQIAKEFAAMATAPMGATILVAVT